MFRNNNYRYTRSMVYDYSRVNRIQRQRQKKNRLRGFFLLSFYFFLGTLGLYFLTGTIASFKGSNRILSPFAEPLQAATKSIKGMSTFFSSGLEDVVKTSLEGTEGNYSVVIKNLQTGEQYTYREHEKYLSASLYKLWTMGAVYTKIKEGALTKDQKLSASIESLNDTFDIASDEAELTEGDISETVDTALEQMITISHNYSALLLTSKIGLSTVKEFLSMYGFAESKVGTDLPETTASDIAQYYELLYNKKIVSDIYSDEMLSRLKRQKLNDRIPKYLPEDTAVAHKTGELYGYKHDAGIVYTPKGDYIIVMMSNSKSPAGAAEREAKLSEAVYRYFEGK